MLTTYFFLEQFRQELLSELEITKSDIFFEAEGCLAIKAPARACVWAQQILSHCQILEFASIGEAAKGLLASGKGLVVTEGTSPARSALWVDCSVSHHRRSALIAEKLRCRSAKPLDFLDPKAQQKRSGFCLIGQNTLVFSHEIFPFFAQGQFDFNETKAAPSRAYLKLWEFFSIYGVKPEAGEVCLDMGSCPGGWTWVLTQMGCRVFAVDKAPLEPELAKSRLVTTVKKDAFTIDPKAFVKEHGKIDWFFSDIICEPARLRELIENWRANSGIENFVCTVKFKGKTDLPTLEKLLKIPGSHARHLYHNKHEVTWWVTGPVSGH